MVSSATSPRLVEFLKVQENEGLLNGNDAAFRHKSPEGGLDTIGYGHKLTLAEMTGGHVYDIPFFEMEPMDAEAILMNDLHVHEARLALELRMKGVDYFALSAEVREALLEMQFNLGSVCNKFPTFTAAMTSGDYDLAKEEYKRYYRAPNGQMLELKRRNEAFYEQWLSDIE